MAKYKLRALTAEARFDCVITAFGSVDGTGRGVCSFASGCTETLPATFLGTAALSILPRSGGDKTAVEISFTTATVSLFLALVLVEEVSGIGHEPTTANCMGNGPTAGV